MTDRHLTIFQMNDTHAYLEAHHELVWTAAGPTFPVLGGYARIASLLAAARNENPSGVLALDNGDTFHGTHVAVATKGEALVAPLNALHLDAMTGHWDFAWGPEHVARLVAELDHPMLAINCYDKATGQRPFPASIVLERANLRIGIIGIAATIIDKSMPASFSEGVRFTLGIEELPAEIDKLRNEHRCDLIVGLSHLGLPQDFKLATLTKGIDVLLSGHTHNRLESPIVVGDTILIQSGCHGSFIGRLDLVVADGVIKSYEHRLIPVDASVSTDSTMQELVDTAMQPYREMLSGTVGHTSKPLHRNTNLYSTMDDLLLAAASASAGTTVAFSNGWRYGAPIPPGAITMNDLHNIIPGDPPVSTVELTGDEIRHMLEENLERTFARPV